MTDHDALVRAICEYPDDDTPRLIYADFLEESGEAERAAFVRAQIEKERTPYWEPFAVLCQHRKVEWSAAGKPFLHSLPALEPDVEWHERPFRRGLGWRVKVRSLHTWKRIAPRLFETAPVGELDLNPPSVRDDWIAFAQSETTRHLRVVHLDGMSPVEPIRALCGSPFTTGITDIHLHRASSPGLPELIEDLLKTPLGHGLKGLHFHVGYESLEYLIDALASAEVTRLERLSFTTMGLTPRLLDRLFQSRLTSELQELEMRNDRLGRENDPVYTNWFARLPATLNSLRLQDSQLDWPAVEALATCRQVKSLRALDLSRNVRINDYPRLYDSLAAVRILDLHGCMSTSENLMHLTHAVVWPNLVGLDLRYSRLGKASARHLMAAPIPPELTVLKLKLKYSVRQPVLGELAEHFGERLIVSP